MGTQDGFPTPSVAQPQAVDLDAVVLDRVSPPCALRSQQEVHRRLAPRVGDPDLAGAVDEPRQQVEQLVDVAALVQEVRAEHELPWTALEDRLRSAPVDEHRLDPRAVAIRVVAREAE